MLSPLGALIGAGVGLGSVALLAGFPLRHRISLEERLAPYLRDRPRPSALLDRTPLPFTPFPTFERVFRPVVTDLARRADLVLGGTASVRCRLAQSGTSRTVEQFRVEQVLAGAAGAGLGAAAIVGTQLSGRGPAPLVLVAATVVLVLAGIVGRDVALSRAVARRSMLISAELPTVAELLALAVTAGEGPVGALERVAGSARGELAGELARALGDARSGATLLVALRGVAARTAVPNVARFVDGLSVAVERGTPLAEVLRAQAVDAREAGRRSLLEAGGKKEIAMLAPVVFLILPIVVLFALYPGVVGISTIAH
jgi:tight adherence protein C